ncbi:pca operon transcription factor PcaQ [Polaromonas sp. AER18D-145]|uniref:pca operon transcription factor PcaQ n=1 Tax=Polaromonas sp. AER18D-145 TaxID=1977060 RepID=UPI001144CAAC|nr:pca operon transcription factor PcaQ [Polaromonas sp. AER18D-145]
MVSINRLKIRHLHTLVAVAEQGTLMRAAEVLSVTQPAVSKTLADLEQIVGQRLFERTPKGLKLTSAGRVLLRYAGSGLRAIREGLDSISDERTVDAPALLIGALPNVAATILPPALLRFAADLPHARVTVRTGSNAQLIAALHQGALDLVIGRLAEPSAMQALTFEHLYTEPLVLAVRPAHALARRRRITADTLSRYRLVLPDAGTQIREAADRFFLASGMGLAKETIETIDVSFGRSYVLQSDAVWCVPLGVVEDDLSEGALVRLALDTRMTEGPVGLTQRVDRSPSEAMSRLVQEIRQRALERLNAPPLT